MKKGTLLGIYCVLLETYWKLICLANSYVLAKMEEDSEDEPHGHITSLAVKRSHRYELSYSSSNIVA